VFSTKDIPWGNPNKFAIGFLKHLMGGAYLSEFSFEASSINAAMEDIITSLKCECYFYHLFYLL